MSKRLTDASKWTSKPWFRRLTPKQKCLWMYLCDNCDVAGVIDLDLELASFCIGEEVAGDDLAQFNGQLEKINGGKYWIVDFVPFQCGELSDKCPPHKRVIELLKGYRKGKQTLMQRVHSTLQDKEEDKEEEGDEENAREKKQAKKFTPPAIEEVKEYCQERGNSVDPERFVDHYEANGWVQGKGKPIKDWKAAVRNWEKYDSQFNNKNDSSTDLKLQAEQIQDNQ